MLDQKFTSIAENIKYIQDKILSAQQAYTAKTGIQDR